MSLRRAGLEGHSCSTAPRMFLDTVWLTPSSSSDKTDVIATRWSRGPAKRSLFERDSRRGLTATIEMSNKSGVITMRWSCDGKPWCSRHSQEEFASGQSVRFRHRASWRKLASRADRSNQPRQSRLSPPSCDDLDDGGPPSRDGLESRHSVVLQGSGPEALAWGHTAPFAQRPFGAFAPRRLSRALGRGNVDLC